MLISPEAILRQISGALIIGDVLAAEILLKIAEGPLLQAHREAVVLAINTKLDTNDLGPADKGHAKMQCLEAAYNYLTPSDLQVLGSEKSLQDKMGHIARRFVILGLRHPTEKTYATLAAIAMLGMEMTIDSEILGMVRQMKAIFRSTAAKLPAVDAPTKYPKTASELKEKFLLLYEAAYQGEEPTVVEDETAWLFRISNVPLRCTRTGCASPLDASITRQGSRKQQDANLALMHMLALHQRANMPSQAPDPFDGINLQIYPKPVGGDRSLPSSLPFFGVPGNQLALEASPPFFATVLRPPLHPVAAGFKMIPRPPLCCRPPVHSRLFKVVSRPCWHPKPPVHRWHLPGLLHSRGLPELLLAQLSKWCRSYNCNCARKARP